jgi:Tfp pilus assembly protein PilV
MKQCAAIFRTHTGLTLMEILMAIVVMTISAGLFIKWQGTTWKQTADANRLRMASFIIEKQIEARRLTITRNPANNFTAFAALTDTTIIDNSVKPPVTVKWVISNAKNPANANIVHVRKVDLIASWGSGKNDSLRVTTCIAQDF